MPHRERCYQLTVLFRDLNRIYFEGCLHSRLSWGRVRLTHVRRTRQLGRYVPNKDEITLNPVLDQPQVPLYVVMGVLHHEMCHAFVPARRVRGRYVAHGADFKKKEREFEYFRQAREWIRTHRKFLFQPVRDGRKAANSLNQLSLFS